MKKLKSVYFGLRPKKYIEQGPHSNFDNTDNRLAFTLLGLLFFFSFVSTAVEGDINPETLHVFLLQIPGAMLVILLVWIEVLLVLLLVVVAIGKFERIWFSSKILLYLVVGNLTLWISSADSMKTDSPSQLIFQGFYGSLNDYLPTNDRWGHSVTSPNEFRISDVLSEGVLSPHVMMQDPIGFLHIVAHFFGVLIFIYYSYLILRINLQISRLMSILTSIVLIVMLQYLFHQDASPIMLLLDSLEILT